MNKIWRGLLEEDILKKKAKSLYRSLYILQQNTGRTIEFDGAEMLNFASNNYLGLTHDKRIIDKGYETALLWGAGSGSSRSVSGTFQPVTELENEFAVWTKKESALIFNSGYNANVGLITALADSQTVVFCDRLNHASIYDGILLSQAKLERYPHKDMSSLKKMLEKHNGIKKKIIITDAVFSMEGDIAPLKEICKLSEEYGCLSIVDEAHSAGLFGETGSGLVEHLKLQDKIDIIMGTLGKSFGVFGAYASADKILIEYLINNCRPFIFTTGLPPFIIGALNEGLSIIKTEKRGKQVLELSEKLRNRLKNEDINTGESQTQIIPVITGENSLSLELMTYLKKKGIFAPAIRPPTVPPNTSRIRISVTYLHTENDLDFLFENIRKWFGK